MNVETFLEQFGHLADAPDGIKKLRELILDLAVRGRLVEQDSTEVFIEQHIKEDEIPYKPYKVPDSWRWKKFSSIANIASCLVHPTEYLDLPHVAPNHIEKGTGRLLEYRTVKEDALKSSKHHFFSGQILYSKIRPNLAKTVIVNFEGLCSADMYPIESKIYSKYLLLYLLSAPFLKMVVRNDTRVAMPKVNKAELSVIPVPVPPDGEQKRIVAKVDELMALCDELETQQQQRQTVHAQLTTASLHQLTTAETPRQLTKAWQRIDTQFDQLFTTRESIKQLRQTILQLAVQGKLVPQDPEDEPAERLLNKPKMIRSSKVESDASVWREPYAIPPNWTWVRLGDFGPILGGGTPSKQNPAFWSGKIPWVSPKDMKSNYIDDTQDHISEEAIDSSSAKLIPEGSLLMVIRGMILIHSFPVALTKTQVAINQDMKALTIESHEMAEYLLRACKALRDQMLDKVQRSSHGTCRIDSDDVVFFPIPLPPINEQKRIVAKVDQMMELCDQLEQDLKIQENQSVNLSSAMSAAVLN